MKLSILFSAVLASLDAVRANPSGCLCPDSVDETKDYFPHKVSPQWSQHWDIQYHNTYKILTNKLSGASWLLYQCGTTPPASEEGKHQGTFRVPLQSGMAISSTTDLTHLEQLGLRRQLKGMVGGTAYIGSPCFKRLAEEELIESIGYDAASRAEFEAKHVSASGDPVVFLQSSGTEENTIHVNGSAESESKDVYEWHKVFGALYNMEKVANEQFDESAFRYDCAADNAAYLFNNPTQRRLEFEKIMTTPILRKEKKEQSAEEKKPVKRKLQTKLKVLWASHTKYGYNVEEGSWNLPAWDNGDCSGANLYYCELVSQCQGEIVHSNDGAIPTDSSQTSFHMNNTDFFEHAKDADIWLYPSGNWNATYYEFPEIQNFKSVVNGEVYDNLKTLSTWFEHRISEYDLVLQDICSILGYGTDESPHERMYFRKALPIDDPEPIGDLGVCEESEVDKMWEDRASDCTYIRDGKQFEIDSSNDDFTYKYQCDVEESDDEDKEDEDKEDEDKEDEDKEDETSASFVMKQNAMVTVIIATIIASMI